MKLFLSYFLFSWHAFCFISFMFSFFCCSINFVSHMIKTLENIIYLHFCVHWFKLSIKSSLQKNWIVSHFLKNRPKILFSISHLPRLLYFPKRNILQSLITVFQAVTCIMRQGGEMALILFIIKPQRQESEQIFL